MDIASVYLNLATLLGTEIEVEGYYDWAALYSIDYNRESLSVTLPTYVGQFGLINMNYALAVGLWPELTICGYLRQNHRGDPILDPIYSIVYTTDHMERKAVIMNYRAGLIYDGDTIICDMRADVIYNQVSPSTHYLNLKTPSYSPKLVSKPVLIEAEVASPPKQPWEPSIHGGVSKVPVVTKFSITLYNILFGRLDFAWQSFVILLYICFMAPLIVLLNIKRIRSIHHILWKIRPRYQSIIWLQNKEDSILRRCLSHPKPHILNPWEGKLKFLFAGQLRGLSVQERKTGHIPNYHHVTFASLDFIRMSRTITFKRPQEE